MKTHRIVAAVAGMALVLGALRASATLAVDWGGDYVTNSQAFINRDLVNGRTGGFSGGNPLPISPTNGYAGTSASFYGAIEHAYSNYAGGLVLQNASNDRLEMKGPNAADNSAYLLLWKQANFLNGMDAGNVGFASNSTVWVDLATYTWFNPGRVVLRQGTSYYASSAVFNSTSLNETQTAAALSWFAYAPATSLTNIGASASIVSGGQIANVTEVGFLFTSNNAGSDAARVENFEVNLVAIPEPATAGLLALGAAAALRRRRR